MNCGQIKKGKGAPGREPPISEEEQKKMMAYYYKKQEDMKVSLKNDEKVDFKVRS